MPGKTLQSLIKYTSTVQTLNADKDQLKNILGSVQPQAEKAWKEEKEPVINYSVIFRPEGSKGILAELVPNKTPFAIGTEWAKEYPILKVEGQGAQAKQVEKKAVRWLKGDLTGNDPVAIPVSPQTTAFLADKVVPQLRLKIADQIEIINGQNKGMPNETDGLFKDGDNLATELHKLSLAK